MKTKINRIGSVLSIALLTVAGYSANAAIYTEKEITVDILQKALSEEYSASKSEDGKMVIVKNGGIRLTCKLEPKQTLVVLRIGFSTDKGDKQKKLLLCNRYNDEKVVARFSVDKDEDICIDSFLPYDGGVNTINVIHQIRWMYSVATDFLKSYKKEISHDD